MHPRRFIIFVFISTLILSCTEDDPSFEPGLILENFSITLTEKPANNLSLGKVNVTSDLLDLSFSLDNQSVMGALRIDASTGELFVNDSIYFDINTRESIEANVLVSDGESSQVGDLVINLEVSEETIQYFKDIALGFEFGSASEITRRWADDIKIFADGSPSSELFTELNDIISELNALITQDIQIKLVGEQKLSNFHIYFGSGSSYAQRYPSQSSYVGSNWGLFSVFWNGATNELNSGHMYVDINRANALVQRHLLREELTQSLGLAKDSPQYPLSIFQQDFSTKTTKYAVIDKKLIYLLYHPTMQSGLNNSQVDFKLREILTADW